jgi:WD40 repeat protein
MWLVKNAIERPLVAAEGELFAVAVEKHLWVFDARGALKHEFKTDWYPYSLCFGKGGKTICMGHDNTLVDFDLERNRSYDLQELPAGIDNLAQSYNGTIIAVGGEGVLMPIDAEGRVLKTFSIDAHARVFCASGADAILVWDGYGAFQVVDAKGKEIVSNKSQPECCSGMAISPDGKLIAAGMHGDRVCPLEVNNGLAIRSSYQTIGSPKALAFHPTKPILFAATDDSYLHVFHLENGPMFTKRLEGYVANDMAFGSSACVLSMVDGYIHNLKLEDDKEA